MEANNRIIFDKDSFLLYQKGTYEISEEAIFYLPVAVISELFYVAGKKDVSIARIKGLLKNVLILNPSIETALIYSDIRRFFSRKEKSGNSIYRDNLYYLASLAIEYGYNLVVSKENYNALKNYPHDDLVLVKSE